MNANNPEEIVNCNLDTKGEVILDSPKEEVASNFEVTEQERIFALAKLANKRKIFLEKVSGKYGNLNEVNKLLEDPEISDEDVIEYMNYCEHAPANHRNRHSWNIYNEMKKIAHLKGINGIIWREDVTGVLKALEDDHGEITHFLIVSTLYGSFGLTKGGQIIKEFI